MSNERQSLINEIKLESNKVVKEERDVSDKRYAVKLIETMMFSLSGLIFVLVIGQLVKLVLINR